MARDANGTYTLPAGIPVAGGTVISSTMFNAFTAEMAVALTESLSREGDGGMNVAFKNASGSVSAPGVSWTAENNSGFYRISAGVFGYSVLGTKVLGISAAGLDATAGLTAGTLVLASGSITDTSGAITFGNENLSGSGTLTWTGGGALTGTWSDLGVVTTVDINGGSMDGVPIGASSPSTGAFTTLSVTGNSTLVAGSIDNMVIGAGTAAAGTFTTVTGTTANFSTYSGLPAASTSTAGIVQLYDGADSTSTTLAATAAALKAVNDAVSGSGTGDMLSTNNLNDVANAATARDNLGLEIGVDVQAYDATIVVDADIGSTVQAFDATILVDADIGVNVQAYAAVLAGTTASYTTAEETKLSGITALADVTGDNAAASAGQLALSSVTSSDTTCFIPLVANASTSAQNVFLDNVTLKYNAGTGVITATDITVTSDLRHKKTIDSILPSEAWATINALRPITHEWIEGADGVFDGFIAQDVRDVAPQLVNAGDDGDLSMAYHKLVVRHTAALQDIYTRLKKLECE